MASNKSDRPVHDIYEEALGSRLGGPEIALGPWASLDLVNDPKRLAFVLARYKFVSKMLAGKAHVMEVGCGDALGLPIVAQAVGHLHAVDWDSRLIANDLRRLAHLKNVSFIEHDMNNSPSPVAVDAVFSVDVIEHIDPQSEARFMEHQLAALPRSGVMIVGTPNETASAYASPQSEVGHINLKTFASLKTLMTRYFDNVFMFGMNDEVLHTGYAPMCHYLWAVGAGLREPQ